MHSLFNFNRPQFAAVLQASALARCGFDKPSKHMCQQSPVHLHSSQLVQNGMVHI